MFQQPSRNLSERVLVLKGLELVFVKQRAGREVASDAAFVVT